ncbi:MAG: SLBB domain-containing protein [Candidatus Cloacimonetes bacterium]|nr:SLBB domain-containing protein [Candidatus Cloacimonadota bacterium]
MKKMIFAVVLFMIISSAFAQGASMSSYNTGSVYLYSGSLTGSEQLKIKTYIWGQVKNPGLYIVPDNTDILTLISSAGGPTENAKLSKIRIIRPTAEGEKIKWVQLKEYMETGNEDLIPILQPGDTVIVSGTIYYAFQKMAKFLSNVAIVLSVYTAIANLK